MLSYNCVFGQSYSDVCLNTYGTMDYYVKMLNDNNLSPNDLPSTGQVVNWDETLVQNQTIRRLTDKNKIIFATLLGYGVPEQTNPIINMYKDVRNTSYTATTDDETELTLVELQGAEIVQIEKEIKPLKSTQFIFDDVTGKISLLGGLSLATGESLFILYKKQVS